MNMPATPIDELRLDVAIKLSLTDRWIFRELGRANLPRPERDRLLERLLDQLIPLPNSGAMEMMLKFEGGATPEPYE